MDFRTSVSAVSLFAFLVTCAFPVSSARADQKKQVAHGPKCPPDPNKFEIVENAVGTVAYLMAQAKEREIYLSRDQFNELTMKPGCVNVKPENRNLDLNDPYFAQKKRIEDLKYKEEVLKCTGTAIQAAAKRFVGDLEILADIGKVLNQASFEAKRLQLGLEPTDETKRFIEKVENIAEWVKDNPGEAIGQAVVPEYTRRLGKALAGVSDDEGGQCEFDKTTFFESIAKNEEVFLRASCGNRKAIEKIGWEIGKVISAAIQKEYDEYACMKPSAQWNLTCKIAGQISYEVLMTFIGVGEFATAAKAAAKVVKLEELIAVAKVANLLRDGEQIVTKGKVFAYMDEVAHAASITSKEGRWLNLVADKTKEKARILVDADRHVFIHKDEKYFALREDAPVRQDLIQKYTAKNDAIAKDEVRLAKIASSKPVSDVFNGPSLKVAAIYDGKHGGSRYQIERKPGKRWENASNQDAPQGDPRWIFDYFDAKTASFFGFEIDKGRFRTNTVTVPDHEEFVGGIREYNALAAGQGASMIKMGIYAETDLHASPEKYLRIFASEWKLPVALNGPYFHHDLNYHAMTVLLMPDVFTQHAAHQTAGLFEFHNFLKKKYPEFLEEQFVKDIWDDVYSRRSKDIDFSTGAPTQALSLSQGIRSTHSPFGVFTGIWKPQIHDSLSRYCHDGKSVSSFLTQMFLPGELPLPGKKMTKDKRGRYNKALRELNKKLQEFQVFKSETDPNFSKPLSVPATGSDILKKIEERAKEIQDVINRSP